MAEIVDLSKTAQKKKNAEAYNKQRDENALQQRMFKELEEAGLLKVTQIVSAIVIWQQDTIVARMLILDINKAIDIQRLMIRFFLQHKMAWTATVEQVEIL